MIPSPVRSRIGIAGPSGSGKTTVARIVAEALGARLFSLDDYYVRSHPLRTVVTAEGPVRSFEHPAAYDGARLAADMAGHAGPAVSEGFLVLTYPEIADVLDIAAFVDVPWEVAVARRAGRAGQTTAKVDAAFGLIGHSEWEAFGQPQSDLPGILTLDGRLDPQDLAKAVILEVGRRSVVARAT